ncbi:MAG: hypothetical protein IPG32_08475 [Saprospirales bacterium]|nr:hypothetical protein [Saprospirales bacterium]
MSGYYWYLPAYLIYQDPVHMEFKDEILKKYIPTWDLYQAFPYGEGYVMKYSLGLALQYLPFFAIGHIWALGSDYPADGFSLPYQVAIHWGSLLVAFLGLWVMRLNLRRFFSDTISAITLLGIGIGTNYFNYASVDAALSHNYLFTLYSLLIYATIRWHEKPGRGLSLAIGGLVGLAALTRPTDLLCVLIPLLWGWDGGKTGFPCLESNGKNFALAALAAALVGSLQLFYWKSVSGEWVVYSYQDQGFNFLKPHLADVFLSYKKGWLVYTPIMVLALLGIPLLLRKKGLFWLTLIFLVLNFWIVSSWEVWWYGGSFGQRAMVQSYALLAFPMAAFSEWAWKKGWSRMLFLTFALFCIALNLFQTWQARGEGGFDPENMNKAYYWHIFFNPRVTEEDHLILDSDERPFRKKAEVETLFFRNFESPGPDSLHISRDTAFRGSFPAKIEPLTNSVIYSIPFSSDMRGKRIGLRLSGRFFGYKKEWDIWKMGQLHLAFALEGTTLRDKLVRVPRLMKSRHWVEIGADFHFPEEPFDEIRLYFANPSEVKTVYIDDLKLEVFAGK